MIPFQKIFGLSDQDGLVRFTRPMPLKYVISSFDTHGYSATVLDNYYFSNCLKKHPKLLGENDDYVERTIFDFLEAEQRSERYNALFYQLVEHPSLSIYLEYWRHMVRMILGKFSYAKFTITSGATSNCQTGNTPVERFHTTECTSNAKKFFDEFPNKDIFPWDSLTIGVGKGEIVPKTAYIGRLIGNPCAANALVQKSIGNSIRQRLLAEGVDLSTAPEVHKRLACLGSIKDHITTDDEKWASALIYTELVKYLCPPDWFEVMNAVRDQYLEVSGLGKPHRLHQFATMGNGFCFELETVIFLALIRTAAHFSDVPIRHKDIRVFGDDLIYPTELTSLVRALGKNVGFITNVEKSFSQGSFRESCGGDFYKGLNIRPVYLKRSFDHIHDLTLMANQLYELNVRHDWELPRMKRLWLKLIKRCYSIDPKKTFWGPHNQQGCLHGRPLANIEFQVTPSGCEAYKCWAFEPVKKYSFREIAYKKDPVFLLRMITGGYLKGMGQRVKEFPLRHWIQGPIRQPEAYYPAVVNRPGTRFKSVVSTVIYFQEPSMVPEDRPLDVFSILPLTGCAKHIYAENYLEVSEVYKVEQFALLVTKMAQLVAKRKRDISMLGELEITL